MVGREARREESLSWLPTINTLVIAPVDKLSLLLTVDHVD